MEIPENVRQTLAVVVKYHFWILALLVPLIALPVLFMGTGDLSARIARSRQQIDGKLSQARGVQGVSPHPNAAWAKVIQDDAAAITAETQAEWQQFWDSQRDLRRWPEELGAEDFLPAVESLKPGGVLPRPMLVRYQRLATRLVRELPRRLGAADEMEADEKAPGKGAGGGGASAPAPAARAGAAGNALVWSAEDQRKIYASFDWPEPPTTTQVLLAQEELWVYGSLCDLLGGFNRQQRGKETAGPPIAAVNRLVIGYRATETEGAGRDGSRIFLPKGAAAGGEEGGGEAVAEQAVPRPPHPRFEGGRKSKSDDDFRNWIYVDFSGKPLMASDLAGSAATRMVHLVPFVIDLVVDEREIDPLLVAMATWSIPIDVRQVRVDANAVPATPGRRYDVRLQLRGTVALATEPRQDAAPEQPKPAEDGA